MRDRIRLFKVFKYTLTGAWFFFGKNPGEGTVHLWSLNLAFPYPNYIGIVLEQPLSIASADAIEIECQGGSTNLHMSQIRYLQKAEKAQQMQCIINNFREKLKTEGEKGLSQTPLS